jgi:quinol monooxygenase YgiN
MNRRQMLAGATAALATAPLRAQSVAPVYVVTYLDVTPAAAETGAVLAARYASATRTQSGNLGVLALHERERPNGFVVIEAWQNMASFEAHEQAPRTLDFRQRLHSIERAPYDQRVHTGFAIDPMPARAGAAALYVVTHVDIPLARAADGEALLRQLANPSRAEPGHVRYDIYQQIEPRTNHFTVFAAWSDRGAFDAYGQSAHWLKFREALASMIGAPYDERLYRLIRS